MFLLNDKQRCIVKFFILKCSKNKGTVLHWFSFYHLLYSRNGYCSGEVYCVNVGAGDKLIFGQGTNLIIESSK